MKNLKKIRKLKMINKIKKITKKNYWKKKLRKFLNMLIFNIYFLVSFYKKF